MAASGSGGHRRGQGSAGLGGPLSLAVGLNFEGLSTGRVVSKPRYGGSLGRKWILPGRSPQMLGGLLPRP